MDSRVLDVRNAVVAFLDSYDFGHDFVTIPSNVAFARLEEINRTQVYVSPGSLTTGPVGIETRGSPGARIHIVVTIVRPLLSTRLAEQDELVALAEKIGKVVYGQPMAGAKMASVEDGASRTLFAAADLENSSTYVAEMNLFYVDGE